MNTNKKNWITSKTLWLAIVQGLIGIFTILQSSPEFQGIGGMLITKSVLDIILRFITNTNLK